MYAQGVVENEVVHELAVEIIGVFEEEGMEINEFLLDGAIEAFEVSVHLRSLGIGVVVNQVKTSQFFGKVFLELTPIIREHVEEVEGVWKRLKAQLKELLGSERRMGGRCPGKAKSRIDIFKGDHVSSAAVHKAFHGV